MSIQITVKDLDETVSNLNRRMQAIGSAYCYQVSHRYGYCALDRMRENSEPRRVVGSAICAGTKREVWNAMLHMITALDDAASKQ